MSARAPAHERIGPYRVEHLIGQGAFGAVYLARAGDGGAPLAIKTLRLAGGGLARAEARLRFARGVEAARRLRHPGIARVVASGEADGLAWIAMDYLPGRDLSHHVAADGLLPPAQVVEIAAQLADALGHAHRQGVVHRDIKPANVIYDAATGTATLTDFGIARVADAGRTQTGLVLGTPACMAPELLAGGAASAASDLYALGVLAFQLLCARLPHEGATLGALISAIANQPAPDVRTLRPGLPDALAGIVARLLAKPAGERPADGVALALALREVAASVKFSRGDPRHNPRE